MAKTINFSFKRFLVLFVIVIVGALVIALSNQADLHINWRVIANTVLLTAIVLRLAVWGLTRYRASGKPDQQD